jgi:hypothetical protein
VDERKGHQGLDNVAVALIDLPVVVKATGRRILE